MQVASIQKEIERRQVTGPSGHLVRLEIFAHGALCMAVSGKCYLSLHSHFASANRGACIQNCRRSYIVTDKDEGMEYEIDNEYIMSAKDLCTIPFLPEILQTGVSVLKIEGRGRSADYVYKTTLCYREAINACFQHTFTEEKVNGWMETLSTVYNRGFWDGYYLGRKLGEWSESYGSVATKRKIYVAKGVKYFEKATIAEFYCESHSLSVGDYIMVTGPTTGYVETTVGELRVNGIPVTKVERGTSFTVGIPEKIRPSDKLYKVVENT
jgi:putative protease